MRPFVLIELDLHRSHAPVTTLPLGAGTDRPLVFAPYLDRAGIPVDLGLRVCHQVEELLDGRIHLHVDIQSRRHFLAPVCDGGRSIAGPIAW
jgi:hypothetical protein